MSVYSERSTNHNGWEVQIYDEYLGWKSAECKVYAKKETADKALNYLNSKKSNVEYRVYESLK